MDHERAFLQAIREEPDDDAHRLIHADWLEEHGNAGGAARAAFIRAQCRAAALPMSDPARADLEDEAADLLAEHEREWTRPLHELVKEWHFARGFVEGVTLRGEDFLTHAERLFECAPIRAVHLLMHSRNVPRLAACPHLRWIEALDFRRCHLSDRALQQLLSSPYLTRLKTLHLGGNDITTAGMQTLLHSAVFAQLRRLDLSHNRGIGDRAIHHLLAQNVHTQTLEGLSLAATNATTVGLQELLQSSHLPLLAHLDFSDVRPMPMKMPPESRLLRQLHSLDLSGLFRHPGDLAALLRSCGGDRLRALHLRDIYRRGSDAQTFAELALLTVLNILDLRKNNLGDEGACFLADSPHLATLTQLNLGANNIRDGGARAIAESPHLGKLTVLDLTGNGIGGPGLQALARSSNLSRLRVLNLAGNFIGTDSVRGFAESPHLSRLSTLDLGDAALEETSASALASANLSRLRTLLLPKNLLGDGGAKALAQSPQLARLTTLNLNDNRIGKAGAEALAASPHWRHLRELDLRGNVFTDTQEALLRDRFGDAVRL